MIRCQEPQVPLSLIRWYHVLNLEKERIPIIGQPISEPMSERDLVALRKSFLEMPDGTVTPEERRALGSATADSACFLK